MISLDLVFLKSVQEKRHLLVRDFTSWDFMLESLVGRCMLLNWESPSKCNHSHTNQGNCCSREVTSTYLKRYSYLYERIVMNNMQFERRSKPKMRKKRKDLRPWCQQPCCLSGIMTICTLINHSNTEYNDDPCFIRWMSLFDMSWQNI